MVITTESNLKPRATTRHSSLELRGWTDKHFVKLARMTGSTKYILWVIYFHTGF